MIKTLFKDIWKHKTSYFFMIPFLVPFAVFTIFPIFRSIYYSFTYYNILEPPKWIAASNYIRLLLQDDVFMIAVQNTLVFAVVTGPVSFLLCFVFAWIINEMKPGIRTFLTLIFYAPSISGAVYVIWGIIFSEDRYGLFNNFLLQTGLIDDPVMWLKDPKYILTVLIIVQLWLSLGTGFLSFIAGLQGQDKSLYEAGAVDGIRSRWQELWYITLPEMKNFLMFGAVMQITASFSVGDVSTALAGFPSVDYAAHTVMVHLSDYGTIRFDLGYASAIATVLFLAMVGTNKLVQRLLSKVGN